MLAEAVLLNVPRMTVNINAGYLRWGQTRTEKRYWLAILRKRPRWNDLGRESHGQAKSDAAEDMQPSPLKMSAAAESNATKAPLTKKERSATALNQPKRSVSADAGEPKELKTKTKQRNINKAVKAPARSGATPKGTVDDRAA
jgi:hypothetical protein